MDNLEANIVRSFAEVRKDISDLRDEVKKLKEIVAYTKTKSRKTK